MTTTAKAAADTLGISLSTVYRRCRNGQLNATKTGGRWIITLPSQEITMADITGTDRQIRWADSIRDEAASWIKTGVNNEALREHYLAVAARITDASWWIDHRYYISGPNMKRGKGARNMIAVAMTDTERQHLRELVAAAKG